MKRKCKMQSSLLALCKISSKLLRITLNSRQRKRPRWSSIKSPITKKNKKWSRLLTMIMAKKKSKLNNPWTRRVTAKNRPMKKSKSKAKCKLMVKKNRLKRSRSKRNKLMKSKLKRRSKP